MVDKMVQHMFHNSMSQLTILFSNSLWLTYVRLMAPREDSLPIWNEINSSQTNKPLVKF